MSFTPSKATRNISYDFPAHIPAPKTAEVSEIKADNVSGMEDPAAEKDNDDVQKDDKVFNNHSGVDYKGGRYH